MAVLTADERAFIRRALADLFPVTWQKPALNDAAQAVEDLLTANANNISQAINTATSPYGVTFTAAQKKAIVAWTLLAKYLRDK